MVPDDDLALVAAVRNGDTTAYRGLVERYQTRVYHLVFGMVRNREDAREITQDAFVKAYRNLHAFRDESRFYTWLYRIAMNLTIDFVRRRDKGPVSGADEDVAVREPDGAVAEVHHAESPRRAYERKELHAAILGAVGELPEDQRQVVLLREIDGLSYKEIAEIVGVPEGTVMSRLFYARKKLQAALAPYVG
jgi:RNA polymerase sigma-70 factor (ECF subfamily)